MLQKNEELRQFMNSEKRSQISVVSTDGRKSDVPLACAKVHHNCRARTVHLHHI